MPQKGEYKVPIDKVTELYWGKSLSILQIAKALGVGCTCIRGQLLRSPQGTRTYSEAEKLAYKLNRKAKTGTYNPGPAHPQWRGGKKTFDGYFFVYAPGHPRARKGGRYVPEHILVWEQTNNRQLPEGWCIHHLNGNKTDNRPENLLALPNSKHEKYIPALKKRIRELEAKVKLLERTIDNQQLIWWTEN
jgi:hypothetical protein